MQILTSYHIRNTNDHTYMPNFYQKKKKKIIHIYKSENKNKMK